MPRLFDFLSDKEKESMQKVVDKTERENELLEIRRERSRPKHEKIFRKLKTNDS